VDAAIFGSRIREARERLGISQEELAERLNKKQRAISEYENGNRRMFVTDLPDLAQVLGVPVSYFFDGEITKDQLDEVILSEFRRLSTPDAKQLIVGIVRQFCDFVEVQDS
jgi:transcriptional regulator with XRE-family HTH domain